MICSRLFAAADSFLLPSGVVRLNLKRKGLPFFCERYIALNRGRGNKDSLTESFIQAVNSVPPNVL